MDWGKQKIQRIIKLGKQMSELSIENTHKLLLEDRSAINISTMSSFERTQLLMQNTNEIKELLQLKLLGDSQLEG